MYFTKLKMKIILIGNYPLDRQESMEKFAIMLKTGFIQESINVDVWRPLPLFGLLLSPFIKLSKWTGYMDKYLLFPFIILIKRFLLFDLSNKNVFHVCDHSNAMYIAYLPTNRTSITCHDVLAIRGALGFEDAFCSATTFGKILQNWILKSLNNYKTIISVSKITHLQLLELTNQIINPLRWKVINNAFNAEFTTLKASNSVELLNSVGLDVNIPYILHVGSALPRKNRKLLLEMIEELGDSWHGIVCFAGQRIDKDLNDYIQKKKLEGRIISIFKPNHQTLLALYQHCEAFIFPSYSEGFGWPVIEAQACGVPVIASNHEPMPDIGGGAAININPNDPKGFAHAFLQLQNSEYRDQVIERGIKNVQRFDKKIIITQYLELLKPYKYQCFS
jgi:glycosyltransferase involved in cell wall biosynthesis